jgi:flap endonuclease-1
MGLPLRDIVPAEGLEWSDLAGRTLAIDGNNMLYQFLATIRQRDGQPFTDEKGRITSHLIGLLYRTVSWLEEGVRPIWIFDGKPPDLKAGTLRTRFESKERAQAHWDEALAAGDLTLARRFAAQTSRLTRAMVEESMRVVNAMGLPTLQAPSEGEAQGAYLAAHGVAWATASEDYDSLLFGTPRLVRGLGARQPKGRGKSAQIIDRRRLLETLKISDDELLLIGLVVGTDFNDGAPGYGARKALKLVQRHLGWDETLRTAGLDPEQVAPVAEIFRHPEVEDLPAPSFAAADEGLVTRILVEEHGFSSDRVATALGRIRERKEKLPPPAPRGRQSMLEKYEGPAT